MSKWVLCGNCGDKVTVIWGDDETKYTGRCLTCGAIYQFVTPEDLGDSTLSKEE